MTEDSLTEKYMVCPTCGGIDPKSCMRCRGKGRIKSELVSSNDVVEWLRHELKFDWNKASDKSLTAITVERGRAILAEIERLQRELAQHKEDAYERALDLKHFIAERDRLRGDLAETRIALANAEMRLRHHGLLPADETCVHDWQPMTHYGKPGTGFDMCSNCGEDRVTPEETPAPLERWKCSRCYAWNDGSNERCWTRCGMSRAENGSV